MASLGIRDLLSVFQLSAYTHGCAAGSGIMNRTDTLESGRNHDIRLEDMRRAESPRISIIERKQNIFGRFLSFARSLANESPDETGWVASTVKPYIANCSRDGDHDWANYVEAELNSFRKLALKHQYKLNITVLAYPFAPDPATLPFVLRSIETFNELRVFLEEPRAEALARLVFVPLDTELLLEALGFLRKAQLWTWKEKPIDCISVMILALFGALWNIDSLSLCQLGSCLEEILMKPEWTKIQLPSNSRMMVADKVKQLTVLLRAPLYSSAQVFYATRPHSKEPDCAFVNTIYVGPGTTEANDSAPDGNHSWSAMITGSHIGVLKDVIERYRNESITSSEDELRRTMLDPLQALSLIEKQCVTQASETVRSLSQSLYKLQYAGRSDPSYGKLDYLLHVSDHLEYAHRQLKQLLNYPPTWPASASTEWRTSVDEDQKYVIGKVEDLIDAVASTKKLVKDQLGARYSYRNTMLTILAAVYIPMTFTTVRRFEPLK
ncbi:hypothetical protein MMC30_002131 [Trapelia coarctata]|nr:hypothetical protein [Trapelia coarctata]